MKNEGFEGQFIKNRRSIFGHSGELIESLGSNDQLSRVKRLIHSSDFFRPFWFVPTNFGGYKKKS